MKKWNYYILQESNNAIQIIYRKVTIMKKEIVLIGGGFAGVNFIRNLKNNEDYNITLVDKNNYNFFPPLLYQVATAFLEVSNISYPFRRLFRKNKNLNIRLASVTSIDPVNNKVILSNGELNYDYLVLATGTESNFFGMDNIEKHALPMKTVDDAIHLRNTMLFRLETATIETDPVLKRELTTVVIAGGGPTGVEIAGMLAEMKKNIIRKDYPELRGLDSPIYLVDGANALLSPMSEKSQKYTLKSLTEMGVKVKLNCQVKDYIDNQVFFSDGEVINTQLLFWTAGVISQTFDGLPKEFYGRGRRLIVDQFNKIIGTQNIYAIGDTCIQTTDKNFPAGHPQLAQVAIQQ
ncbi:MAG: NAD(P)/FAD-dependent oxidoreductase, partial [Ferruginibacter sp.]